jgi:putative membrane protein
VKIFSTNLDSLVKGQRMSKITRCFLLGIPLVFAIYTAGQSSDTSSAKSKLGLSAADAKFVKEAADGGMAEVELGKLAADKGSSGAVKQFGQRMVDDHGKANEQLKQLALQKNVDLPQETSAKHKAIMLRLEKLSGSDFDKAYVAEMLKDHKEDVAAFQRESRSAKDPDIKSFAAQTLPTLQEHLKQVQGLSSGKAE